MNCIAQIFQRIENILVILNPIDFFFIFFLFILAYHILVYFLRDKKYINAVRNNKDPDTITIDDLRDIPLINIIVAAWKERELFKECLISLTELSYPKLRVIVNAGGNEETLNIARSFKKFDNFVVLHQKGGGKRASLGKVKALNECLPYVSEGLLYMIDADVYVTDETLIRMIYPLINKKENVVVGGIRPFESIKDKDLVKYLLINRNLNFRRKFSRYGSSGISGANTCIKYEVIKLIGKFTEDNVYAEDMSRGEDFLSKGFRFYRLTDYRGKLYCEFPDKKFNWLNQKIRWNENSLIYSYKKSQLKLIKFVFLWMISFYIIIFPFFLIFNIRLFIIGIYILVFLYMLKIRRFIFFKLTTNKKFTPKFKPLFFIKIILFIYLEILITFLIPFHLLYFRKNLKRKREICLTTYN